MLNGLWWGGLPFQGVLVFIHFTQAVGLGSHRMRRWRGGKTGQPESPKRKQPNPFFSAPQPLRARFFPPPFAVLHPPSTNGAIHPSLGYRPRKRGIETIQGLKARSIGSGHVSQT
jgi:hypothetical protein